MYAYTADLTGQFIKFSEESRSESGEINMTNLVSKSSIITITILFLTSMVLAQQVAQVLEPVAVSVQNGGTVNLGTIGPGQTLAVTVNGTAIGNKGLEANWGVLGVMSTPNGWTGFDSAVFAKNMKATIKADPDAANGVYTVEFKLTECQQKNENCTPEQGLGSVTFYGTINVSSDVLVTSMPITNITTGVNQPARYPVIIENNGNADDVFQIYATGVPGWNFTKSVFVPAGGTVNTFYEIAVNEESSYLPTIVIQSSSSNQLSQSYTVALVCKSNLVGDLQATKNGVLLFPIVLEPLYSLMGIFGYVV